MSTYKKITKNPSTGLYENATWHDDYFGRHLYGVEFSDGKIYPPDYLRDEVKHYWAEDVKKAFGAYMFKYHAPFSDENVVDFLNLLSDEYKARWKRDPASGEGAFMPPESNKL
jgi:hypothetical protein